ncbi:MAG TPA: hypothetical protein VFV66_14525 [Nonomuraea sp.]|nr:hypothetical protein [Nonomuraea sp.]
MVDHDRDGGSRGSEDVPRDPAPGGPVDGGAHPRPRSGSFRDFLRRKPAQLVGAGLVGLFAGALIGGGAVALVNDLNDRHHHDVARHFLGRDGRPAMCHRSADEMYCELPRVRVVPNDGEPARAG